MNLLLLFLQASVFTPPRLERTGPVGHPPNMVGNAWVIAELEVGRNGRVQATRIPLGVNPFKEIAQDAVTDWQFKPARTTVPVDAQVTAVFLFRPPQLFAGPLIELPAQPKRNTDRPPLAIRLSDPGYPANSVGEGAVILELRLSATGAIENTRVVSDVPGLAAHTEKVVRAWKFEPALRKGSAVPGTVIAVVSYLRPV